MLPASGVCKRSVTECRAAPTFVSGGSDASKCVPGGSTGQGGAQYAACLSEMLPDVPPLLLLLLSNAALPLPSLLVAPAALLPQPLPAVPASPLLPQPLQLAAAAGAAVAAQGLELAAPPLLLLLPPPLRGRTTVAATRKVLSPPPAAECATTSGSSTLQEAKDKTWTAHHAEARAGLPVWSDRPESEAPVLSQFLLRASKFLVLYAVRHRGKGSLRLLPEDATGSKLYGQPFDSPGRRRLLRPVEVPGLQVPAKLQRQRLWPPGATAYPQLCHYLHAT